MARNLLSLTISAPTSDPNQSEGGSFTFTVTPGFAGGGGVTAYDLDLQWDQGTATWQTIPGSGGLSTAGTAYYASTTQDTAFTITVDCNTAGDYNIRAINVSRSVTSTPTSQAVTVTASNIVIDGSQTPDLDPEELDFIGKIPELFREDYITPAVATPSLALSGKVPTLEYDTPKAPAKGALALAGKIPATLVDNTVVPTVGYLTLVVVRGLQLLGHAPTFSVSGGGGSDTPRNPPVADPSLALSGKVPTFQHTLSALPAVADQLTLGGKVPTFQHTLSSLPAVADQLTLDGKVPTVGQTLSGLPAVADQLTLEGKIPAFQHTLSALPGEVTPDLTLSGKVPTIKHTLSALPDVAEQLTLDGKVPLRTVSMVRAPDVATPSLALSGKVPTFQHTLSALPGVATPSLVLNGKVPLRKVSLVRTPDVATPSLALSGKVPTIKHTLSAVPAVATLALDGKIPALLRGNLYTPAVADPLVLAGKVPTFQHTLSALPGVADPLALAGKVPTIELSLSAAPTVADPLVLAGKTPVLLSGNSYAPAVADPLTLAGQAPTIRRTLSAAPGAVALTLSGTTPTMPLPGDTIPVGGAILNLAVVRGLQLLGHEPTVLGPVTFTPAAATLTLTGVAPPTDPVLQPAAATLALVGKGVYDKNSTFDKTVPVAAGALTLTSSVPTRAAGLLLSGHAPEPVFSEIKPDAGSLTLSGKLVYPANTSPAPVVTFANALELEGKNLALEVGTETADTSLTLVGYPLYSLMTSPVFHPAAYAVTLTPHTPSKGDEVVAVDAGALALTAQVAYLPLYPGKGSLALSGKTPTFADTAPVEKAPAAASLTLTGPAPGGVNVGTRPAPAAATLSFSTSTPTLQYGPIIVPAGALTLTTYSDTSVLPGAGTLSLTGSAGATVLTKRRRRDGARLRLVSLTTKRNVKMLYD